MAEAPLQAEGDTGAGERAHACRNSSNSTAPLWSWSMVSSMRCSRWGLGEGITAGTEQAVPQCSQVHCPVGTPPWANQTGWAMPFARTCSAASLGEGCPSVISAARSSSASITPSPEGRAGDEWNGEG